VIEIAFERTAKQQFIIKEQLSKKQQYAVS